MGTSHYYNYYYMMINYLYIYLCNLHCGIIKIFANKIKYIYLWLLKFSQFS